jgi:protein-L-isoaspartate(D-aspartate) O-methyltransferase
VKRRGTARRGFVRFRRAVGSLLVAVAGLGAVSSAAAVAADAYAEERRRMVDEIAAMATDAAPETGRPQLHARTLDALARVPRHRFVPRGSEHAAYRNRPLAIGRGQTISQPYIVALMTDLLELAPGERVLEIGTGSGYQAAVLAELGARVYTVEIVEPLALEAARRLTELGYDNVETRIGDGHQGWPEHAPYDAIIVTAAAPQVPPELLAQLRPGGRMVVPLGQRLGSQVLYLIRKRGDDSVERQPVLHVRFVPFTGKPQPPAAR